MSRIKKLSTNQDVLKSIFDVTKGKNNPDLQAFVQEHMGWESSVNVRVNQPEVQRTFELLASET